MLRMLRVYKTREKLFIKTTPYYHITSYGHITVKKQKTLSI
ncbi:MAG: hypothetical protein ACI9D4_001528 [Polaribacter sp.]|jgi:hypothetical protein